MNKTLIKVIKRKDAEIIANAKIQRALAAKQTAPESAENTSSRARGEITGTVSNWIAERRENNRLEKNAAIRQLFGSEPLLSEV